MAVKYRIGAVIGLLMILAGCATQLVPFYDKALVKGLTYVNIETMGILAATANGTTSDTFEKREDQYNRVIGNLDALALQSAARPAPKNNVPEAMKKIIGARTIVDQSQIISSATALDEIAKTITKMRDTDRKQGITGLESKAFKGQIIIFMDQALTYEAALER